METAIKIEHLNKTIGKRHIIKDLSFETYSGEVFGFLGPNGAGKTTTIKMIVGLLRIDDGKISICDVDVTKDFEGAMKNIGGIVENPECYKYMTGMQNLMQYARMRKGVTQKDIKECINIVGLSNRINEKISKYSLGMRQRLGVAQALLHHPKVLILDEPTNGLDPAGIKELRDILKKLAHEKKVCVLVSSHLMSEMELMCDRVGIINNGALVEVKTMDEVLSNSTCASLTLLYNVDNSKAAKEIIENNNISGEFNIVNENKFEFIISNNNYDESIYNLNKLLINNNVKLYTVSKKETTTLENAFIELTQKGGTQID